MVMGFPWVSDQSVDDMPVRAVSVGKDVVLICDMGVHSLGDGSRVRISLAGDDEMAKNCFRAVNEVCGSWSVAVEDSLPFIAEDPELSKEQVTGTVRRTSLLLDCSRSCAPGLVVFSVNWCASTSRALTLQAVCMLGKGELTWVA